MKKIILFAAIALTAAFVFTSCNKKSDDERIVGTWNWEGYYENGEYRAYTQEYDYYTFHKDGSLVNRYKESGEPEEIHQGTWKVEGSKLTLSDENGSESYEISFPDGDTMHWVYPEYPEEIEVLKRQ